MATAVSSSCSSISTGGGGGSSNSVSGLATPLPPLEKGQSNKRKLPCEAPRPDARSTPLCFLNALGYDQDCCHCGKQHSGGGCEVSNPCSVVKHSPDGCEVCTTLASTPPANGSGVPDPEDADWNDLTELELKEILLSHIGTVVDDYIRKMVALGHTDEDVMKAVLKAKVSSEVTDPVSSIMDSALALLQNEDRESALSQKESTFESLDHLENHILESMIFLLREARPFLSYGDAMWLLLVCDLDTSNACQINIDPLDGSGCATETTQSPSATQTSQSSTTNSSSVPAQTTNSNPTPAPTTNSASAPASTLNCSMDPRKNPNINLSQLYSKALSRQVEALPSDLPLDVEIPKLLAEWSSSLCHTHMRKPGPISGKGRSSSSHTHAPGGSSTSHPHSSDEKSCTIKKSQKGSSKKNSIMMQKSILFEKHYTTYGAKGTLRAGKFSGLGSLVMDKKCKGSSSRISMKNSSIKISKSIRLDATQGDVVSTCTLTEQKSKAPLPKSEAKKDSCPSLIANTDLSTSSPSVPSSCSASANKTQDNTVDTASQHAPLLAAKMTGNWVPKDKKDEFLLQLTTHAEELRLQLEDWTDWAQQKVMQAARRLNKDKAEIQALRHEKDEADRFIRERQNLEQSSLKKLSEIESALLKADCQQAWATGAKCRLEIENSTLRQEMESVKLQAAESASSCLDLSRRGITTAQKSQSCDQDRHRLQDEIVAEKHKLSELQKQLDHALENQCRLEGRWKQEQKVKDEARAQANSLVWERQQIEATAKSKEDLIRLADGGLQKRICDVQRLENRIRQLKDDLGSSTNSLAWSSFAEDSKQLSLSYLSEFANWQDGDLHRDRECVMCMVVEKSVVFLPCGHQVVCVECNDLHEKQGMKDCPSCRTPIQKRILARFRGAL